MQIQAKNIAHYYKDHTGRSEAIFGDLCFAAEQGKVTAIVGPSGSGKSTLLGVVAMTTPVQQGELFHFGDAVHALNERQRAARRASDIGFIFQDFALIQEFFVLDNCALPMVLKGESWKKARILAHGIIERLIPGLNAKRYPYELSGGQQQRVAVARALVHQPRIIIADEPTGNLDTENSQRVQALLKQYTEEQNTVTIVVTHDTVLGDLSDSCYCFEKAEGKVYKYQLCQVK